MNALQKIFTALIITAVVQTIYYYPRIPSVVASHFDGLGDPNGWSSKAVFFGIYAAVLLLTIFIFAVLPGRFINQSGLWLKVSNKKFWFAPERKNETIQFIRSQFLIFGIVNALLAIFTIQLVIQANFKEQPRLDSAIVWG